MCICIVAMIVAASGMVMRGGPVTNIIFGSIIVAVAGVMIFQVHWTVTHLGRRSQLIRRGAVQAEQHYINVLRQITHIVEARDRYNSGHSEHVGKLAERIARQLGLPPKRCEQLNLAGQLHDIGLLAVPDGLLRKQEGFGIGDYRTVQKHSEVSYELLRPLESLADVLPAIRSHHERLNGTGYPLGLAGDDIPLEARILAVADAYDAMTHDRPQRNAMSPLRAMEELRRCTPSGYDGRCVEALAQIAHLGELREIMSLVESNPATAQG
jgi:HD-GYP domain-containing protein (c-di-GMP phosphodiesterase class II)